MSFSIKMDSSSSTALKSFDLGKKGVKQGLRMGAYISGKQLTKFLKDEMTKKGRSGRRYLVYRGLGGRLLKKPRLHQASAAGEYPAVISGNFRKSIDFEVKGYSQLVFGSGANGLAEKYAKALEFGTSKMTARKPVGRTVSIFGNKIQTNLIREINKQLKIT
jgi:hypothetical protein